jgi:hypothetical protein
MARRHRFWSVLIPWLSLAGAVSSPVVAQGAPTFATEFYRVDPCRAVDTREGPEELLVPGAVRLFTLDGCGVPLTAYAVALNVTVVNATAGVEVRAFPGDSGSGSFAAIVSANPAAPTRSALAVLRLATDGTGTLGLLGVFAGGAGQAHIALDVFGYFDLEDPGSTEDPGNTGSLSTLGEPELPYDGDPRLLDDETLYPPDMVGRNPSDTAIAPLTCTPYSGDPVTPIGVWGNSPRYLSYAGKVKLLVGASADVACHFLYTKNNLMLDKCNAGASTVDPPDPGSQQIAKPGTHYETVLAGLEAAGFNKTRLWVALGWEKDRDNVPFAWDPGGYWRLDVKNQGYFDRLRAVVRKAKELDIYVEVTFFAPFQGGGFSRSPWSYQANLAKAPDSTGRLTRAGFTSPYYFVVNDPDTGLRGTRNERMRQYQQKVIEWTIKELWCYDNVFWEIANEAEDQKVLPLSVAAWQRAMISTVIDFDQNPALTRPHLIAVQPFTKAGGDSFVGDTRISILNGHYTQVLTDRVKTIPNPPGDRNQLDLGAIQLAQRYGNGTKVLGFNEGKITPLGGPGGTRSHVNGIPAEGPEGARAEAWEFMFDRGGILDHWGYLSKDGVSSPTVQAVRGQLAALKTFMAGVPLAKLRSSTDPPGWIINSTLNNYPAGTVGFDNARNSQRYWSALQTDETAATGRLFLLYIHHSTRRCTKVGDAESNFSSNGCPGTPPPGTYLALGGYDARVWTAPMSKRYRDNFALDLGPNPGTFDVLWINPANLQTVKQQVIAWRQSTCSIAGCIVCSNPSASNPCSIGLSSSEGYDFDILLKISQR